MIPVNMNHLYYFFIIAKNRSFTTAARELMVSQSSLSIQMKQLEQSLGVTLFNRKKTGVELTETGEVAYQSAEKMFNEADNLLASIERVEHLIKGNVAIGTVNSVGIYMLPDVLKKFKKEYSEVKVTLEFKHAREVVEMVQLGKVDLGIITWDKRYPDLTAIRLQDNKLFLVAHPKHPLARKESVSPRDLEQHPFIAYEEGTPTRLMMDALFKRMSLDIEYIMESSNVATIKHMVLAELGLAFLPEVAVGFEIRQNLLARLSIPSLAMVQEITLYHKTNRALSKTKQEFLNFICRQLGPRRSGALRGKSKG